MTLRTRTVEVERSACLERADTLFRRRGGASELRVGLALGRADDEDGVPALDALAARCRHRDAVARPADRAEHPLVCVISGRLDLDRAVTGACTGLALDGGATEVDELEAVVALRAGNVCDR